MAAASSSSSTIEYEDMDASTVSSTEAAPGGPTVANQSKRKKTNDANGTASTKRTRVEPKTPAAIAAADARKKAAAADKEKRAKKERERKECRAKLVVEMKERRDAVIQSIDDGVFKPTAVILAVSGEPVKTLLFREPAKVLSRSDYEQFIACNGRSYAEDDMVRSGGLLDDDDDDDDAEDGGDDENDSDYHDDDEEEGDLAEKAAAKTERKRAAAAAAASATKTKTPSDDRNRRRREREAKKERDAQSATRALIMRLKNTGAGGLGAVAVHSTAGLIDYTGWWVFQFTSLDEVA